MQQQVQINQPPERVLSDAATYFTRRRAKVSDRDPRGFRFGLEGADAGEGGRVTVAAGPGGGSTVTVQADGLGVMAIAEGFVRELRKHARSVDRRAPPARDVARGGFGELRERLGMPEPVAQQRPPRGAAPAPPAAGTPSDAAAAPAGPDAAAVAAAPPAAAADVADSAARPAHPDGQAPVEAPAVSEAGP
jgi:hypothetical protein